MDDRAHVVEAVDAETRITALGEQREQVVDAADRHDLDVAAPAPAVLRRGVQIARVVDAHRHVGVLPDAQGGATSDGPAAPSDAGVLPDADAAVPPDTLPDDAGLPEVLPSPSPGCA